MRVLTFLFIAIGALQVGAQLQVAPLNQRTSPQLSNPAGRIEQNSLPFWDDFSVTADGQPDKLRIWGTDTTRQWSDSTRGVFVNSTLSKNPPSFKVVTFDGLDASGQIYADETGLTDQLYSDTLDLGGFTEDDNLYISFYWQAGGNVENPDNRDSIRLQFYNIEADTSGGNPWQNVWKQAGSESLRTDIFFQETIRLEERFINDTSIFRFQAFGDQNGPFDAWHLDWIYLNANRQNDDFFYFDRGITGQLTSPFAPFKSLPTHQLLSGSTTTGRQTTQTFNLYNQVQPAKLILTLKDADDNTILDSLLRESVNPQFGNTNPFEVTNTLGFSFEGVDFSSVSSKDSLVLESTTYIAESVDPFLAGTDINLRINDTIRTQYLLHDFYAYDDGTAEYAAGVNRDGDQLGVQFWLNEPDTLTQVDIYFPNIAPDSDGQLLNLRIFRDLETESLIYSENITVTTATATNEFTSYVLGRPLVLSDTFFITCEQGVNRYIGIGLDRSNDEASQYIFENTTGVWTRNQRVQGALMIRPVFKNIDGDLPLSAKDAPAPLAIQVYPNPSHGIVRIAGRYSEVELRNMAGQLLRREGYRGQHDFSDMPPGLYLLKVTDGTAATTQKIILK